MNLFKRYAVPALLFAGTVCTAPCFAEKITPDSLYAHTPWTGLTALDNQHSFRIAILADRSAKPRPGVFEKSIDAVNLLMPDFAINVGDLIMGEKNEPAVMEEKWAGVDSILSKLRMPFFRVPGNHDLADEKCQKAIWHKRYGPVNYSFSFRNTLFLCLNSIDSTEGHISAGQTAWVKRVCDQSKTTGWTFVLLHHPIWNNDSSGWRGVEQALGTRNYSVFAGHTHRYASEKRNNHWYYTLATSGGESKTRGLAYGEFDHVTLVTVGQKEPVVTTLLIDGVLPDTITTVSRQAIRDSLYAGRNWKIMPIMNSGSTFSKGTAGIFADNKLGEAIHLRLRWEPYDKRITLSPNVIDTILSPRSSSIIPLTLVANSIPVKDDIAAGAITWETRVDSDPAAVFGEKVIVPIVRPIACHLIKKPVSIDGSLAEWPLPIVRKNFSMSAGRGDSSDCRFGLGVQYDSLNLYIGMRVYDSEVLVGKEFSWADDGVQLLLDAGPDTALALSTSWRTPIPLVMSPSRDSANPLIFGREWHAYPDGVQFACVPVDSGYIAEVAVPITELDKKTGKPWRCFRLHVAVTDRDSGSQNCYWWRPDWRTDGGYSGSSTFVKAERVGRDGSSFGKVAVR